MVLSSGPRRYSSEELGVFGKLVLEQKTGRIEKVGVHDVSTGKDAGIETTEATRTSAKYTEYAENESIAEVLGKTTDSKTWNDNLLELQKGDVHSEKLTERDTWKNQLSHNHTHPGGKDANVISSKTDTDSNNPNYGDITISSEVSGVDGMYVTSSKNASDGTSLGVDVGGGVLVGQVYHDGNKVSDINAYQNEKNPENQVAEGVNKDFTKLSAMQVIDRGNVGFDTLKSALSGDNIETMVSEIRNLNKEQGEDMDGGPRLDEETKAELLKQTTLEDLRAKLFSSEVTERLQENDLGDENGNPKNDSEDDSTGSSASDDVPDNTGPQGGVGVPNVELFEGNEVPRASAMSST